MANRSALCAVRCENRVEGSVTAITSRTLPPAALRLLYIVGYSRLQFSDDKIKHVALSSVLPYYDGVAFCA
jgi:hypothetical protein